MELRGTTMLRSLPADKQNEGLPTLDPALTCEGISGSLRPTSSARVFARMSILAEQNYTRLRYTIIVGQLAPGKRFKLAKMVQRIGTNITPVRHALWQFAPANAAHANRRSRMVVRVPKPTEFGELLKGRLALDLPFSIATPLHLMSDFSGFKRLPEVWAFRLAILELGQPSLLGMHVGRIWSCFGPITTLRAAAIDRLRCITSFREAIIGTVACHKIKQPRNCMFQEISAGMASAFNTVADEQSRAPHRRRLLISYPENLRNTVNPETAMASRWNRTRDGSNLGDVWLLGNISRRREEYFRLMRTPLCASSAVASPDTAVATV